MIIQCDSDSCTYHHRKSSILGVLRKVDIHHFPHAIFCSATIQTAPFRVSAEMGWLSSIFGTDRSADPLGKLDPKLREFLEKESPVKYTPNQQQPAPPPPTSQTQRNDDPKVAEPAADRPAVPAASLYQDGRYAHLWKNYRPLSQVEAESATDHDKLMSVLEGFKGRKAAIGKAGLENCALQQEEWINCMKHGSWEDQLQMCRHQVRRFERCYTMQSVWLFLPPGSTIF